MTRITVPTDKVRTREAILAGQTVIGGHVWLTCGNCGGSGNYPSSLTPPGRCRFYCWSDRTPVTYGKRPVEIDAYVKRQQAADRRDYRAQVQWELDAPAREQAAREAFERDHEAALVEDARRTTERERKAVSQWVGQPGERLDVEGRVERVRSFQQAPYRSFGRYTVTRYVVTLRDAVGNQLVWFADSAPEEGATVKVRGTVKDHSSYRDEKQTTLQRVKEID